MRINDAYDYLVHLVSCAVGGKSPDPLPDGVTYKDVLHCAARHDLIGLAYLGVLKAEKAPDADTLGKWEQCYLLGIKRHFRQEEAREELLLKLRAKNIATLELQGTKIKPYYPSPELRTMSDIDFIIKKEDTCAAKAVLEELGYSVEEHDEYEIVGNSENINIEFHTDFFPENHPYHKILSDPFRSATIDENCTASVSDTVFWTYHLLHCLKHYFGKGIGLRRILDLYFLEPQMEKTADIAYVNEILKKNELSGYAEELFDVAGYWFGGKPSGKDIEKTVETIKSAGTHGNARISLNNELSAMQKAGQKHPKLRQLWSVFFPTKERMYHSYPYCKEHNYPYLLCLLHRAIRLPFMKGSLNKFFRYIKNLIRSEC